MCPDGIHTSQDYIDFAAQYSVSHAVCLIIDQWHHTQLTGVLITPTKILTAAHGFISSTGVIREVKGRVVAHFGPNSQEGKRYRVHSVKIHPEYLKTPKHSQMKYDLAILELEQVIEDITPIEILPDLRPTWQKGPLIVFTFGSFDWTSHTHFPKRAFAVPEVEILPVHEYDPQVLDFQQNVMLGSLFFNPTLLPAGHTETAVRANRAIQCWNYLGKPPYALALPGSSGSPLIRINSQGKAHLIGLVSGFTHLALTHFHDPNATEEADYIRKQTPMSLYNTYQTLFSLIYQKQDHPKTGELWVLDQRMKQLISEKNSPAKNKPQG
jgi:hypothetical protein